MEALQSNDPAFLETCHRWLLFHYHCNDCGQSKDTCEYGKVCSYGKSTFMHVQGCARNECAFPRCDLIKAILRHHQACKDETCQLCSPVYKYQARSKGPKPQPHSPFMGEAPSPVSTAKLPQPQQSMPVQIPETPHHAGMLFEARHREQCQLSSSLRRSSWTPDATASESGGGCTLANAPSGSLEAAAGLQRLHLEKLPQQQQQQQCTASSSRVSPPPQPSSPQPTATSLQHTASSNNCLDMASSRSDLSTPVPAGSGLFMTPAAVAGVPTAVAPSSGLVATDNGAGPGAAALWGTFQLSGLPPPQVVQAHQQLQQLQGHFPAGNYGNTATSVLLPPQLTGAS
ncbi:hypothetical protein VOLCADRAFT_97081 [Volvox carteri f. nagariensis]|uniref:histone acetyltransferase n=1 Tax=Volvox carteri f. nagariensis TaxID=3068 RepID=D8UBU7_VOLCA|nr:uncharacterized protein VOLCADRAFT_97081 [Volvox carteri f. nagariensis]EFJ42829.1 hypothetical protein VOLCADRAFT_97081 [Volvox carteri f. nagariensis]|eukprot:XP_002956089.1 hypothetical protein VOLCADRAFT_97081 [Volvox carteri f. nagariensis]